MHLWKKLGMNGLSTMKKSTSSGRHDGRTNAGAAPRVAIGHGHEARLRRGKLPRTWAAAGKVAVITGGDSGIGRAVAIAYAREGADVLISHLNEDEDAEDTARLVRAAGRQVMLVAEGISDAQSAPGRQRPAVLERTMPLSSTFTDLACRPVSPLHARCCGVREHSVAEPAGF